MSRSFNYAEVTDAAPLLGLSEHYGECDHGLHEPCRRPARPSARWGRMMGEIAALARWKNPEGARGLSRGLRQSRPGDSVSETVSQY